MEQRKILTLLLLATFFKGIFWSAITPLWHTPDEQAHFAQVQNIVEVGGDFHDPDLSAEIALSEELLGTYRDEMGKNRFTHHPEYNLPYTNTKTGIFEDEINSIPLSQRKNFIKNEATNYPPLFYYLSSIPYRVFYKSGLITRAFATRLPSIIFCLLTVYFTYLISKIIFPKSPLFQIASASLVSFQPMFTFVSAGTSSDNLFNALYALFIYLFLKLIQNFNFKNLSLILLVFLAGIYTKIQMYSALFPLVLLLVYLLVKYLFQKKTRQNKKTPFLIIAFFSTLFLICLKYVSEKIAKNASLIPEISLFPQEKAIELNFLDHIFWTARHTIAEVVPWYWGVFKWLGVTLPRIVNRVINYLSLLVVIGLFVKFTTVLKKRKFNFQNITAILLLFFPLYYFAVLMIWDYFFRVGHGFSMGFQGRYYFPTISAHMILVLLGLLSLVPKRLRSSLAKSLTVLIIVLNFIGLQTLANAYYDLSSPRLFLLQVSQYKPFFYKSPFLCILGIIYLSILSLFLFFLVRYKPRGK